MSDEPTLQQVLSDRNVVHVNMLRGTIAKPSPAQIWHIYGAELLTDMPAEVRAHLPTDLSEERAIETLRSTARADGWVEINVESECWQTALRAMHQYAAGLQGEVERLREALEFYANGIGFSEIEDGGQRARTALGDT